MAQRKRDTSLGEGVYYAPGDYIGIWRRIVILVVDLVVLYAIYYSSASLCIALTNDLTDTYFLYYYLFVWAYLTILKASKLRTAGYWLANARIVNLRGKRPSVFRMTYRLLFWLVGPFVFIFDLMWVATDDDRQTLRDRFAGTCVIKNNAESMGTAEIHMTYYSALGYNLMYPRVTRIKSDEGKPVIEESEAH
ncbi:RDD family protein [uncultured Gimesia sp.]|uniref:RDD family protein n=1 Tax=uncultured Gimesia sp. TaxID=1678688 RepID=UPI002616F26D|nr:RDD family protein [uncultured Gimesia sp.]